MRTVAGMTTSKRRKAEHRRTATATDVSLTDEGRALLEGKAAELREGTVPALLLAIGEHPFDEQLRAEHERSVAELHRVEAILADADVIPVARSRSGRARLGHLVTVAYLPSGVDDANDAGLPGIAEQFLLVQSPLGQAVLGRLVGDIVEFDAPAGRHVVRILEIKESS